MKTFSPYSYRNNAFAANAGFESLDKQLDALFAGLPSFFELSGFDAKSSRAATPAARWFESDDAYLVQVDLPGVRSEELEIETLDGELTVTSKRAGGNEEKQTEEKLRSYRKAIQLPDGVEESRISARYENGVLSLTLPKGEKAKPRRIVLGRSS